MGIIARTDSRQAVSLEEALWRTQAFADAGADALFIDALASREEMEAFCKTALLVPKMQRLFEAFLNSELVLSSFDGSPQAAITILKKICDHPYLLTKRAVDEVLEKVSPSHMIPFCAAFTILNGDIAPVIEGAVHHIASRRFSLGGADLTDLLDQKLGKSDPLVNISLKDVETLKEQYAICVEDGLAYEKFQKSCPNEQHTLPDG